MGADYRHGNDWNSTLHCQVERAFLEGKKFAIEAPLPFDVDRHVEFLVDHRLRRADRLDTGVAISAVDRNQAAHAHGASENRNFE